jgi:hypothetical protein
VKVLTEQIVRFATGGTLAPEDLNRIYLQNKDAVDDVALKRWSRSTLTLPFRRACGDPLTQASDANELSWRFICPVECVLEGAELSANMTGTGAIQWTLTNSSAVVPTGATSPYLSTNGTITDVTADTTDLNVDRVVLSAGVEYLLTVSGTAFSLARADVTLRIAVDRWKTSGTLDVPSFAPTMHAVTGSPNATTVNANTAALTTQAAKFAARRGMTPLLFTTTDLAAANSAIFTVPLWEAARARATVVRMYAGAVFASAVTGTAVSVALRNASAVTVGGASNTISASAVAPLISGDSGALSVALTGSGATNSSAADFSVRITNGSAATAKRAFALVWVEWS